ncbi:MAG: hypothetical protein AAFX06_19350 [Planctomycetota bacterium]
MSLLVVIGVVLATLFPAIAAILAPVYGVSAVGLVIVLVIVCFRSPKYPDTKFSEPREW